LAEQPFKGLQRLPLSCSDLHVHFATSPLPYAQFVEESIALWIAVLARVDLGLRLSRFPFFKARGGGESTSKFAAMQPSA